MLKSILSFALILATLTVHAAAPVQAGLKDAFNELNYSLTVEWDQKDQAFYDARVAEFSASMEALKAEGLTQKDVLTFVKSELKDAKVLAEVEAILTHLSMEKMSAQEAQAYMLNLAKSSNAEGASFHPRRNAGFGGLGLLLVVFGVFLISADNSCSYSYNNCYYY